MAETVKCTIGKDKRRYYFSNGKRVSATEATRLAGKRASLLCATAKSKPKTASKVSQPKAKKPSKANTVSKKKVDTSLYLIWAIKPLLVGNSIVDVPSKLLGGTSNLAKARGDLRKLKYRDLRYTDNQKDHAAVKRFITEKKKWSDAQIKREYSKLHTYVYSV